MRPNILKKTSKPNLVKSPGYIKFQSSISLKPIKHFRNCISYNYRRSAVEREELKPYWKSENKSSFSS